MSSAQYLRLRADLLIARRRTVNGPEEDRLLGEMDDAWYQLTAAEQVAVRARIAEEHREQLTSGIIGARWLGHAAPRVGNLVLNFINGGSPMGRTTPLANTATR